MNQQPDEDALLDACLEEVLGGARPPDLTARIMQTWAARQTVEHPPGPAAGLPSAGVEPAAPPVQAALPPPSVPRPLEIAAPTVPAAASRNRRLRRRGNRFLNALAAAALLLIATAVAMAVVWSFGRRGPDRGLAEGDASRSASPPGRENVLPAAPTAPAESPLRQPRTPDVEPETRPFDTPPPFAAPPATAVARDASPRTEPPVLSDMEVTTFVDQALRLAWQEHGVQPAARANDQQWCRRAYLRLLGRIPTAVELQAFLADGAPDRRRKLVDRLLSDEQYAADYARQWSTYWTNVLIGRRGGTQADSPGSRAGLQRYLSEALRENTPFDKLAYELLAATGSTDPQAEDHNDAVHFLLSSMGDKAVLATARTSRVFLGVQLQCVQCHNHPSADWEQGKFWQLNAFFRQMRIERQADSRAVRLVNRDFRGESGRSPDEAEVYYERLNGRVEVAYPVLPDGREITASGRLSDVDRRGELARYVARSDALPRALVNRLWSHFFGYGFTRPIDDMGPYNTPSHPELLQGVAQQFAAHGYDFKSLLRWIALSEAFGLSSRSAATDSELADQPQRGQLPLFSRYYTRQLPPEEVYESLMLVAQAHRSQSDPLALAQGRRAWLDQFSRDMGTDEGTESDTFQGDIRQSLIIMTGPLMKQATSVESGSLLRRVADSQMTPDEQLEHLFLSALARKPSPREMKLMLALLQGKSRDDWARALQDIWWALLNSNEFILDH